MTEKLLEKLSKSLPQSLPHHIGIIMDGNTRWARKNNLSKEEGYQAGAKALEKIISACLFFKINTLTLYTFSTENRKRYKEEVDFLMGLLKKYTEKYLPTIKKKDARFYLLGNASFIHKDTRLKLLKIIEDTKKNTAFNLCLAINYGSRDEIVRAVNYLLANKIKKVSEKSFSSYLDTAGLSDVDLIIRTSGEQRISNFLLWQSAYAEFYFCPTLWPDFDEKKLVDALISFSKRNRTKGYTRFK